MDVYRKREFTYAILINDPANADEFAELGVSDWSIQDPGVALVINRELHRIEETYGDVATAEERYEVVAP